MTTNLAHMETSADQTVPQVQFAQARGARIAYQDFGEGPTVISVPPMAQNVEVAWDWPGVRIMLERLSSFSRWIHFDKRGTGASDRGSRIPGLDERVEDLRAVMDDAGVERAFLYGASEGGPMCVLFAATYPDRVDGLILHGTTASYLQEGLTAEQRDAGLARRKVLADCWGTPESIMAKLFSPSLADDPEYRSWLQRYERLAADRESLLDLLKVMDDFDVRELLADITTPTLVLHRVDDLVIPVKYGRELAAAIPGATLIEHPGNDHFAFAGDQDWISDIERFVTGTVQEPSTAPAPRQVTVHTMGRFGVSVDGKDVPSSAWKSRLPREICKRLVAARGWPITRDALYDELWPDEHDRAKLSARLSVHLSGVRKVLGGGVITDGQTLALDLDTISSDLEVFFAATNDAEIVELYQGGFLPDEDFEDWSRGTRDEARHHFVLAARRLGAQALDQGDNDGAAILARRLIDADVYDERAHRLLVTALVASREHTLARNAHTSWTESLAELDVDVPPFNELAL